MGNDSTDTDEPGAPEEAEQSDPQAQAQEDSREETERIIEREVLLDAADDESITEQAIAELQSAVTEESADADEAVTSARERPDAGSRIPTDTLFELLSSPGNRFVLTYLIRADNPTTYADLVEYVVERAEPPDDTTDAKFRGRVAARLVHRNLPQLATAGLIEHDSDEQTVRATPAIEAVAPHLALAMSRSSSDGDSD